MCAVHVPWARAQMALLAVLGDVSLRDLVAFDIGLQDGTFVLPDDLRPER